MPSQNHCKLDDYLKPWLFAPTRYSGRAELNMSTSGPENTILKSLNQAQRRAVTSKSSTVAILAGPGSGKTHTLTSRVVWLIRHVGYQPSDVIVATFTNKAAKEMKERIDRILGEEIEKKIVMGTFHSIARRYLATYGTRIGLNPKFGIADADDSKAIIQRIIKRENLKIEPSHARSWISKRKAKGTSAPLKKRGQKQEENHATLMKIFTDYQDQLELSNLLDYDDLLVRCVELLRKYPTCVSNVQTVLIDEYQDTNGIQYELMGLFAQAQKRITIVGDPDQSIYGWRSAEIRNLYRLLRDYPDTDEVSLEENYRSSQSILNLSLRVIQEDKNRYQKVLLPVHTKGTKPVLRTLSSSSAEAEWIITEIKRVIMMFGGMLKGEDIVILLRSAALSRQIESALGKAGIQYRMIGGHKFYDRKEIKILIDYLRVVNRPDDNEAIARIINVPRRGIGEATIKSLLAEAEKDKINLWSVLCKHCRGERKAKTTIRINMEQKLNTELIKIITSLRQKADDITNDSPVTLVDLIEQLIDKLKFNKFLKDEYADDHEARWANVQELINLVRDFTRDFGRFDDGDLPLIGGLEQTKEDDLLGKFLGNVSLASDAQKDYEGQDKQSLVTVSTIHAAKGLEWPVVFVPSVYKGSIPHAKADNEDEERRLLYVAMTRAQTLLYLSCPLYGPQGLSQKVELSNFVSPFASTAFLRKGPSFDRSVLLSAAKILRREAAEEKAVFDNMPLNFPTEDDHFPEDPIDPKNAEENEHNRKQHYARASKRQRTGNSNVSAEDVEERPWKREYATTMEQSAEFTVSSVSSLPGFVTAGAHRSAISAAATAQATEKPPQVKPGPRKGTTQRVMDQKSLLGFVMKNENRTTMDSRPPNPDRSKTASHGRYQVAASGSAARTALIDKPLMDPALAQHKLLTAKPLIRPRALKSAHDRPQERYACFSSSPSRPDSVKVEDDESEGKVVADRPATSFHTTTFTTTGNRGIRRPVGMGPPPTMDRLKKPFKPFKPLTINRPRGPPG